jgi:hypothetical protein
MARRGEGIIAMVKQAAAARPVNGQRFVIVVEILALSKNRLSKRIYAVMPLACGRGAY